MNRPTVRSRRRGVAGAVLALWWSLAPGIGSAAEQEPAAPPEPPQPPVYVPPDVGAPSTRVIGGVRGIGIGGFPIVLAPEFTGLTTKAQPTLYWYLGQPQARLGPVFADRRSIIGRSGFPAWCPGRTHRR